MIDNNALDKIYEAQLTDSQRRFRDNFAKDTDIDIGGHNSYLLTSDGCFQRHTLKRAQMYQTDRENRQRNFENSNHAEYEEKQIQDKLYHLFKAGYKLLEDESAEDFINRCQQEEEI